MATKAKTEDAVVAEQELTEGQFRINVGQADQEYIFALNQLVNVPGGKLDFKSAVKKLARQLQARTQVVTSEMYKSIAELGRLQKRVQRAERMNTLTDEMLDELDALEGNVEQLQSDAYKKSVILESPKIPYSLRPTADNLAKALNYQQGNTMIQTDYAAQYAIILEEFVNAEA